MISDRFLGRVAAVCAAGYLAALFVLHLLQPQLDPGQVHVSHYVHGRGGWLFVAGSMLFALGLAALATGLRGPLLGVRGTRRRRVAISLLWIAAVGWVGGALFPISLVTPPDSASGWLHVAFGLVAMTSLGVGVLLVSYELRSERGWRSVSPCAVGLAVLFLVGFALMALEGAGGPAGPGIFQRLALGAAAVWMIVIGHRIAGLPSNS